MFRTELVSENPPPWNSFVNALPSNGFTYHSILRRVVYRTRGLSAELFQQTLERLELSVTNMDVSVSV
jgi:hypothetical protein